MDNGELAEVYGAIADDVITLNGMPKIDPVKVEGYISMAASELNTILAMKGARVPVTAPEHLVKTLRKATIYGAAAMVEVSPPQGQTPSSVQEDVNVYQSEFNRLRDWLSALTRAELLSLGLVSSSTVDIPVLAVGLTLAHSRKMEPQAHWSHYYPFKLVTEAED